MFLKQAVAFTNKEPMEVGIRCVEGGIRERERERERAEHAPAYDSIRQSANISKCPLPLAPGRCVDGGLREGVGGLKCMCVFFFG